MTSDRPMRRLTITIPEELVEGMEDVASLGGGSVSDVVREAVLEHLFRTHWRTVGDVAEQAILGGATNEEALASVHGRHPGAATTLRSISWYRSRLRSQGNDVMTDAEVRRARDRG